MGGSLLGVTVHTDAVTGLLRPMPHCHMLLGGGHIMPVPPDFFLHPHTGRVMSIYGNVAYDPANSALVCTTDLCRGKPCFQCTVLSARSRLDTFDPSILNTIQGYKTLLYIYFCLCLANVYIMLEQCRCYTPH